MQEIFQTIRYISHLQIYFNSFIWICQEYITKHLLFKKQTTVKKHYYIYAFLLKQVIIANKNYTYFAILLKKIHTIQFSHKNHRLLRVFNNLSLSKTSFSVNKKNVLKET